MLFGVSIGWMGDTNYYKYELWGYFYQSGNTEASDCAISSTFTTAKFTTSNLARFKFQLLYGHVKEVYVMDYMQVPSVFSLYKTTAASDRHEWRTTNKFYTEPGFVWNGCGNDLVLSTETTETCDDGNTSNGDGCSSSWKTEAGYAWTQDTMGMSAWVVTCGNSKYEPVYSEQCDDGNISNKDGWSSAWQIESTHTWTGASGTKSTWTPIWGDGFVYSPETWDDGNKSDSQGWLSDWSGMIAGWAWTGGSQTVASVWHGVWGDGFITADEECNDQNTNNLDGWSSLWKVETGWTWTNNTYMTLSTWTPIWGDGLHVKGEIWDDGNISDGIGWKSDWSGALAGYSWSGGTTTTADIWSTLWGDGYYRGTEQCDDGNLVNGDGWSGTWKSEAGFSWTNYPSSKSVCASAWGDGLRVGSEAWDDGNISDNIGCKPDCTGSLPGWTCSGGSSSSADTWLAIWGDGYYRGTEQCDDGNLVNGDGWSGTWKTETGFSWTNYPSSKSAWGSACGDGMRVGSEICDDGNISDNQGCKTDCTGSLPGWTCSSGSSSSPDVCYTIWGDGIHMSISEEWDDGNTSSAVDGCTSKWVINKNWSWSDDILSKSIWSPLWGNGRRDSSDEKWDDGNSDSEDGWFNWLVEDKWQCMGGDATHSDNCYSMPVPSITDITTRNEITIKFSEAMKMLSPVPDNSINCTITGPSSSYSFSIVSTFTSSTTLKIAVTSQTQLTGDEVIHIVFSGQFVSSKNANLYKNQVDGDLNKVPVYPDIIGIAGTSTNAIMASSIATIVTTNVLLSQSWELLWGFLNTMQLIYFFPLMSHYLPDLYMQFLFRLSSSKMDFDFFNFKEYYSLQYSINFDPGKYYLMKIFYNI